MKILPAARDLGELRREAIGKRALEQLGDRLGEALDLRPSRSVGSIGTTTCSPLPPVVLRNAREPDVLEQRLQQLHGLRRASLPRQRVVGIEIEDDAVGIAELRRARAPRMELEHAHLQQRDERGHRVRHHVQSPAVARPGPRRGRSRGVHARVGVLLVEALLVPAVGTAHQRQRAVAQVRQDPLADRLVVVREIALGELRFRIQQLVGIAERDAGDDVLPSLAPASSRACERAGFGGRRRSRAFAAPRLASLAHHVASLSCLRAGPGTTGGAACRRRSIR